VVRAGGHTIQCMHHCAEQHYGSSSDMRAS
jgi:hypothetical protein